MKLSIKSITENQSEWENMDYIMPKYNIEEMIETTKKNPKWIHFGYSDMFRAFPAVVCQQLLNSCELSSGIIVAEGHDLEVIECMDNYENLSISVTLNPNRTIKKEIVASVAESLTMDFKNKLDTNRLKEIFAFDELSMATFSITEKGYSLKDENGQYYNEVETDFLNQPSDAKTYMGMITALLWYRFKAGAKPLSLVSMDKISDNGNKIKEAIMHYAEKWTDNNIIENGFVQYINRKISFPLTMIDKITPRPSGEVLNILKMEDIDDMKIIETKKHTFISPFVNAEAPQYWVIEDKFPNGKLPIAKKGIVFSTKKTVEKAEKMKVSTCLYPLYTAVAIFGSLLNFNKISDVMKDDDLQNLVRCLGYDEEMKIVSDPEVISPRHFIDEVINKRLPNRFMPDSPQTIMRKTSQNIGIYFGDTIKSYKESDIFDVSDLEYIPLVIAAWLRYLIGVDDRGAVLNINKDPLLDYLKDIMTDIKLGCTDKNKISEAINKIISNEKIMGLDLCKAGLGEKVELYFKEMLIGTGAVRRTIYKLNA